MTAPRRHRVGLTRSDSGAPRQWFTVWCPKLRGGEMRMRVLAPSVEEAIEIWARRVDDGVCSDGGPRDVILNEGPFRVRAQCRGYAAGSYIVRGRISVAYSARRAS